MLIERNLSILNGIIINKYEPFLYLSKGKGMIYVFK